MKKVPSGISPLIAVDRRQRIPLQRQIYEGYRSAILEHNLRPGERVPSTRLLAGELGVSRIPILNAYAQLQAEGYFEMRVGAGTVVSHSLPDEIPQFWKSRNSETEPRAHRSRRLSRLSSLLPTGKSVLARGPGAFSINQVALDQFPFRIWNSLILRHCRRSSMDSLNYGDAMGVKELRAAIAAYVRTARGVRCEAEQVMIVSGSQQALEVAMRVLLDPGDSVWMEEPGYTLARNIFLLHGCRIVPVAVDEEGLNVAAGLKLQRKARAAFVTPSHQHPLGVTMSAARRLQLLEWAERSGAWILEDDYDSEYRFETMPISSLQGLDAGDRVIYIGTLSKVLFPSLRLGYLVIPADLIPRFRVARVAMDISPPVFPQLVLADFIREGHFSRHLRRMRTLYAQRRQVMMRTIQEELGADAEVLGAQAGMNLSVILPKIRDQEIADEAARQGLWLVPLSASYLRKPARQGFILGFGNTSEEQIVAGIRKMAALVKRTRG
ncbi:MAG TPA: PLP-dependent aminotransferase family protein [Terriglobales bacterium]|nr:PLP-dependent aminotransferase family protein [Terriglobales bacterium]